MVDPNVYGFVDYDSATGVFSNWAAFSYPNGTNFVTHFEGISSVGLPVHDRSGTVIAAISISGLHVHILADDRPRHLAILQRKVRELELRL